MSFRWLPYDGRRHAVPVDLQPGGGGETLCGTEFSPVLEFAPASLWPASWHECQGCDNA
ncbi:zinc finger protein [Saccharothrix lopnurensis]|uniref:Zinc finger protein n=1 Tax=Saccharothrix lopnurensis TaxID=1670621 RepID=A0ABW1PGC5_9PSEU